MTSSMLVLKEKRVTKTIPLQFFHSKDTMEAQIRIGRIYYQGSQKVVPTYEGFTPIISLTKTSPYGMLGPYCLKDEQGHIMENLWQFSKIYPWVPKVEIPYTRLYPKIVWSYHYEHHIEDGAIKPEYWVWRERGMNNPDPVRYPVGNTNHRKLCIGCIPSVGDQRILGIAEAREEIYLKTYARLVKNVDKFQKLKTRLEAGENLLILETDGPHQESLGYYMDTYDVDDDFIDNHTMLYTQENLQIMLKDTKHSFGHGYCLAMALMDDA